MAFATLLGVAGGLYIYRPYFETVPKTSGQQNQGMLKTQNKADWKNYSLQGNPLQTEARSSTRDAAGLSEPEAKQMTSMDTFMLLCGALCDCKCAE